MNEDIFKDLRKKLLADLFFKQCEELKQLYHLHFSGQLQDTTELYKMIRKVRETKAKVREIPASSK